MNGKFVNILVGLNFLKLVNGGTLSLLNQFLSFLKDLCAVLKLQEGSYFVMNDHPILENDTYLNLVHRDYPSDDDAANKIHNEKGMFTLYIEAINFSRCKSLEARLRNVTCTAAHFLSSGQ